MEDGTTADHMEIAE